MVEHDQLFKDLLEAYFFDFVRLFLPWLKLDESFLLFLDKELSALFSPASPLRADLVARVFRKDANSFLLIHIEVQSSNDPKIGERMFSYYLRLRLKYGLPILPITIFVNGPASNNVCGEYSETVEDLVVVAFDFLKVNLKSLYWFDYLDSNNCIAYALMACMRFEANKRVLVKLECLRGLLACGEDENRQHHALRFIDSYLSLNRIEQEQFDILVRELKEFERNAFMEYVTSWERRGIEIGREQGLAEGRAEGRAEGMLTALLALASEQFGDPTMLELEALKALPVEELSALIVLVHKVNGWSQLLEKRN